MRLTCVCSMENQMLNTRQVNRLLQTPFNELTHINIKELKKALGQLNSIDNTRSIFHKRGVNPNGNQTKIKLASSIRNKLMIAGEILRGFNDNVSYYQDTAETVMESMSVPAMGTENKEEVTSVFTQEELAFNSLMRNQWPELANIMLKKKFPDASPTELLMTVLNFGVPVGGSVPTTWRPRRE